MQLPTSEDGKLLAAYFDAKLDQMKKEIIRELKYKETVQEIKKTPKK